MIAHPPGGAHDKGCLRRITEAARDWAKSDQVRDYAARFGSVAELAEAIRSAPQADDDGSGAGGGPFVSCDYPVRLRENPHDPNCVERAAWYLAVAERMDPQTTRWLLSATVPPQGGQEGYRHVNAIERHADGQTYVVDLFPNGGPLRNASGREARDIAKTIVKTYLHPVGKGIFTFYAGESGARAADLLGNYEDQAFGPDEGGTTTTDEEKTNDGQARRSNGQGQGAPAQGTQGRFLDVGQGRGGRRRVRGDGRRRNDAAKPPRRQGR